MCGIFGVINFDGSPVDKEKVLSARDILAHRGPDDSGIYYSTLNSSTSNSQTNIALAHRRLSIIDLSTAAHQPMTTEDGRYTIVYNGEIYNYEELRGALSSKQLAVNSDQLIVNSEQFKTKNQSLLTTHYSLNTKSDTEVILKLYAALGPECLNYLRGMFAFAIWDDKEKKLFAARDRFGIKPFYYLHNNNEFIFSSELKAIKHYKNGLTTSMEGIDAFLRTGSVPAPLTIYEETKALLPGNWLECKMKHGRWKTEVKQYWSFFDLFESSHTSTGLSMTDTSTHSVNSGQASLSVTVTQYWDFFDLLNSGHTSTGLSMTDTSTHSINSGQAGLSMTSDLSLRSRPGGRSNLHYDEEAKKEIRNSLLDSIKAHLVADVEVGAFLSGGIDSTSIVSLMRQIGHKKIKTISVTFPGFVHDEAEYSNVAAQKFGTDHYEYRLQEHEIIDELDKIIDGMDQPTIDGINTYFVSKAAAAFGLKVVLSGLGGDELFGGYPSFYNIPKYQKIKNLLFAKTAMKAAIPFVKNRLPAKALRYMKEPDRVNAEYILVRGLFTDDDLKELGWDHPFPHPFTRDIIASPHWREKQSLNPLQHVSYLESTFYMRNQLLRDSDIFGMAHSIELRVPFVDHHLYKTVLPYLHSSYDKNQSKRMLVNAVGDLPEEISGRMKMGFTFPFDVWMRSGKLHDTIKDSLLHNKNFDMISRDGRIKLLDKFEQRKIHWSRVWALFVLSRAMGGG
jgi:asparagine synthetase B (glutamine-hydrolysing)